MKALGKVTVILTVLIMALVSFTVLSPEGDLAVEAMPTRSLDGHSENYNVSFSKPALYDWRDPNYAPQDKKIDNNTWSDVAFVVFLQDRHVVSKKSNGGSGSYNLNTAEIYQTLFVPINGTSVLTGSSKTVLVEDFTSTGCGYCTAIIGAMDRLDHDSSWFPSKYVGVQGHISGTYGSGDYSRSGTVARQRKGFYSSSTGIPTWVVGGDDPWVGGSTNANDTTYDTRIKNLVTARLTPSKISITASAGHSNTTGWVDFTIKVIDPTFDNILVDAHVMMVQNAHPRRHGRPDARLGRIMNDRWQQRVFNLQGTPPSIADVLPAEDSVLSGNVEISFTATDPDASDAKISKRVEVKKVGSADWLTISKDAQGKFIWHTAMKSGDQYVYPDDDYEIRISLTDYWGETNSLKWNVSVLNPDDPVVILKDSTMEERNFDDDTKTASGDFEILWMASDDEDEDNMLKVDLHYKQVGGDWHLIAEDLPNTGLYLWDTMNTGGERVPDGDKYMIKIVVEDTDGQISDAETSFSFRINNPDAPTVVITSPRAEEELSGTTSIRWTANDAPDEDPSSALKVDVEYSIDGGETYRFMTENKPNSGTLVFDSTLYPDSDNYIVRVTVKDTTDLTASAESPTFSIYNNDPPSGQLITPMNDQIVSGEVEITWSSDDDEDADEDLSVDLYYMFSGLGTTWQRIATDLPNTGSFIWDTTTLEDGDGVYNLKLALRDSRGDVSPSYTVYFTVYNPDDPVISTPKGPSSKVSEYAEFTWFAEDPDLGETEFLRAWIYYSSDEEDWKTAEEGLVNSNIEDSTSWYYRLDVRQLDDGIHHVKIVIADCQEINGTTEWVFRNVMVDNPDEPTVSFITTPPQDENVTYEFVLSWEGSDPDGDELTYDLYYKRDGGDWVGVPGAMGLTSSSFVWNVSSMPDGYYELKIEVIDTSSAKLKNKAFLGTFYIYNPPDDPGTTGPTDTSTGVSDESDSGTLVIVILLLVGLLIVGAIVVLGLVIVKRRSAAALPPPGGAMVPPPGGLPPGRPMGALPPPGMAPGPLQPGREPAKLPPAPQTPPVQPPVTPQ